MQRATQKVKSGCSRINLASYYNERRWGWCVTLPSMPMCVRVYANVIALNRHMNTSPPFSSFSALYYVHRTNIKNEMTNRTFSAQKKVHIYLKALHRCREVSNEMLSHREGEYQLRTNDHKLGSEAFEECTRTFVLQQIGDNANSRLR